MRDRDSRRNVAAGRRLRQGALWLLLTGGGLVHADDAWYVVEIANGKPPCVDVAEGIRCIGTHPRVARFEMTSGERLDVPRGPQVPDAWVRFNRMWLYAPSAAEPGRRRSITLTLTPMGARLIIDDQGRSYVQSLPLNEWVVLESGPNPKLWVRVAESVEPR